jgi:DNA-directed RNA polymerase I subunit RPA1
LPIFIPFDLNVSSNGFISNRFVTGINQSEFFFHCMAGREGLLDTAVKTSQSGYIQRSLIKHLESISLNYDYSVRFSRGQINQFIYSRDACCPMISDLKSNLNWKLQNFQKKKHFYPNLNSKAGRFKKKGNCFFFSNRMNSLPRIESDRLKIILKKNKNLRKIHPILKNLEILTEKTWEIFYENLAIPGDAVGVLTSQSLGEPCTQMTLNTFHFAGKLESNQKSGVPRLKEILLLSSKFPVTPTMSGKILGNISLKKFSLLQKRFKPIHLNHLLTSSSNYFEKNKYFEGQIFRFFFPKNFFFKHLLSIKMNSLRESIQNFVTKFKKFIPKHSKKNILQKNSNKPNFIKHNNEKIKFEKYKSNFCSNDKKMIKYKFSFLKINLSRAHYFLDCQDIDILLGKNFILKSIIGISDCFIDSREKILHVNGINFLTFWKNLDIIDAQKIYTNDVYGMLINYGIEASRNCLFNELESIFKIQGISISVKHFDFIADYMTRLGNFRGFNRKGFNEEDGFQEITYETAINYILNSSHSSKTDYLTTISSRLSLGIPPNLGTSCFGITF